MVHEPSPAEEARLRRLLARARHDERLPDGVAARLDDVLARLEAGELDDEPLAQVHELAARRRRRAASVLVAAAAVVVLGVGLGQVVDGLGAAGSDDMTAADNASTAESADRTQGRTDAEDAPAGELPLGELDTAEGGAMAYDGTAARRGGLLVVEGRLTEVPEAGFTRTAARIQRRVALAPATASSTPQDGTASSLERAAPRVRRAWEGCSPVEWGEGVAVAVLYEGDPAVLVFRSPDGESQVVDLLQCGTGETLRSVTLPAR